MFSSIVSILLIWHLIVSSSPLVQAQLENAEFVEPLKNITATVGSNLEFSCSVRNLDNSRVIWFYKPREKTTDLILAVNGLKISRNPKISFTIIPRSGDITESILYIFNVGQNEAGIYSCGVNTEPMILQRGTLEVNLSKDKDTTELPAEEAVEIPEILLPDTDPKEKSEESGFFCINIPKMWHDTKHEAEKIWHDTKHGAEQIATSLWGKVTSFF